MSFPVKCCQILRFFKIEELYEFAIFFKKISIFMKVLANLVLTLEIKVLIGWLYLTGCQ